jgi:hypothetical protein
MYSRLSSFDDVAKAYADIKPIKGARANEDLRPLRERRYWWNRVMKISDTKYLLLDGSLWWGTGTGTSNDLQQITAAITWERKEDGDYVTIRNHMNDNISVSRYTFLQAHLPRNMYFSWENGKHYVSNGVNGKDHYLPKSKIKVDWQTKAYEVIQENKIVFKHEGGDNFTRANELQPFQTRRIDKELDVQYKPKIQELFEWMQIVLPVLGTTLHDARSDYANKLTENSGGYGYWYWQKNVDASEIREILNNPEHEKRMALAVCLANEAQAMDDTNRFQATADTLSLMHKIIRKVGKFYLIEQR